MSISSTSTIHPSQGILIKLMRIREGGGKEEEEEIERVEGGQEGSWKRIGRKRMKGWRGTTKREGGREQAG